jgi:uncharacterized protein YndB with AHSA1/START domain
MITAKTSTRIDRPVAQVFQFVAASPGDPAWDSDTLEVQPRTPGPTAQGSEFDVRFKPFMGQSRGTLRVTRFEPDRHLELRGQMGPMEPTIRFSFAASGNGTEVRREIDMQLSGLLRLLQPLMGRMMAKRNAEILDALKRRIES